MAALLQTKHKLKMYYWTWVVTFKIGVIAKVGGAVKFTGCMYLTLKAFAWYLRKCVHCRFYGGTKKIKTISSTSFEITARLNFMEQCRLMFLNLFASSALLKQRIVSWFMVVERRHVQNSQDFSSFVRYKTSTNTCSPCNFYQQIAD